MLVYCECNRRGDKMKKKGRWRMMGIDHIKEDVSYEGIKKDAWDRADL